MLSYYVAFHHHAWVVLPIGFYVPYRASNRQLTLASDHHLVLSAVSDLLIITRRLKSNRTIGFE